jgi:hypothetical protein
VVWFTDAFQPADELERSLRHLRHLRHDVRLVQVIDPAEEDFPFEQPTLFQGLEGGNHQWVTPQSIRSAYRDEWGKFLRDVERIACGLECQYVKLRTDDDLDQALRRWLSG